LQPQENKVGINHKFAQDGWLMANSENPQIVRAMLRWTNLNMLAHYTHGFKADKLEAQGAVLKKLVRPGNPSNRESEREFKESNSS
jgi:hypothetical protein